MLVFLIFFCLFLVLFLLPIQLEVDTSLNLYRLRWYGVFSVKAEPVDVLDWQIKYRIFGWSGSWKPRFEARGKAKPNQAAKPKKHSAGKPQRIFTYPRMRRIFKAVYGAFRLRRFKLDWDTGDFILNAWLYPLFGALSHGNRQLNINFKGNQYLALRLQTSLGALALAGLKVIIHFKTN